MEFVKSMGLGINLGNTFESCGDWINGDSPESYETAWGSPVITKELIESYADMGFGVIRIPVAWSNMMDQNYNINPDYIERVRRVVDWVLESNMRAIVNIHWDGGWFSGFSSDERECMKKYASIWSQISEAFRDCPLDLMFESLNEEGCWNDIWNRYGPDDSGKAEAYSLLLRINQLFVDTIRSSGGLNEKRHLLIAGYATDVLLTCDEMFELPSDPAERCAVSVHYYTPPTFAVIDSDADWGNARSEWGSQEDISELCGYMDMLYERFVKNGIPVIIGEYGCTTSNKTAKTVEDYISSVCAAAYANGMCPVLWDTQGSFFDRESLEFLYPEILEDFNRIRHLERK